MDHILIKMDTPGPWRAKKRFCAHKFFAEHNHLIPIEHETTGYVAYVSANNFDPSSEANARLVAAAPDMLEALEAIVKIANGKMMEEAKLPAIRCIASDTIAKTKGY